jgi:hypothetical protein
METSLQNPEPRSSPARRIGLLLTLLAAAFVAATVADAVFSFVPALMTITQAQGLELPLSALLLFNLHMWPLWVMAALVAVALTFILVPRRVHTSAALVPVCLILLISGAWLYTLRASTIELLSTELHNTAETSAPTYKDEPTVLAK